MQIYQLKMIKYFKVSSQLKCDLDEWFITFSRYQKLRALSLYKLTKVTSSGVTLKAFLMSQ